VGEAIGVIGLAAVPVSESYASPSPDSTCADCVIPLYYDSELAKQGFPSPLVHLKIGDHEAAFIIDTGASVSTFAASFAQEADIRVRDSTLRLSVRLEIIPRSAPPRLCPEYLRIEFPYTFNKQS